jgi:DNA-binding MarR family transcriptional regulator
MVVDRWVVSLELTLVLWPSVSYYLFPSDKLLECVSLLQVVIPENCGAAFFMRSAQQLKSDIPPTTPPLSTLLSQLLIAFTIEFDNEFEHRMPHRTTSFTSVADRGAWLGSMVLWANAMRLIPETGITVGELERQARTDKLQLPGLERWGYISVTPGAAGSGKKPSPRNAVVRPTAIGRKAQEVWRSLAQEIEERWRTRFGKDEIDALRGALTAVLGKIDLEMPEYLPILGYALFSEILLEDAAAIHSEQAIAAMNLSALLAKVLLAYTIEFEFEFDRTISLPVAANVLRLLSEQGVRVADLARLSSIAKEGVAFATGWLQRTGFATIESDPKVKGKLIRLAAKGQRAQRAYLRRVEFVEKSWQERFSVAKIAGLRESLMAVLHKTEDGQPLLAQGLMPYPDGWRARKPYETRTLAFINDPAGALPHQPMVLHRGGYPDGS